MEIVPALAESAYGDADAVGGANGAATKTGHPFLLSTFVCAGLQNEIKANLRQYSLVVRFHAPHVGRGIYQPGQMQRQRVSEEGRVPRIHRFLVPSVDWYPGREQEAENWHQDDVEPVT